MNEYKPLRAALFVYDFLRLAALVSILALFSPLEGAVQGKVFPYLAYLAPNALFPLMALFVFIRFREYGNYLPLYLAGKVITVIAFYGWGIMSLKPGLSELYMEMGPDNIYRAFVLLCCSFAISLGDIFSILGTWFLLNKIRLLRTASAEENGGQ